MMLVLNSARPLIALIVQHARNGKIDPQAISNEMPEYSTTHIAFVLEQLSHLPFSEITQLTCK